jgi:GlpG protein
MEKKRLRVVFNAPVVLIFAFICLIVTVLWTSRGSMIGMKYFMTYKSSTSDPLTYVRAIGHVFGHSGWEHLIGNMSFILLLGPILEEKYESDTLVFVILLTAVATSVINALVFPGVAVMGASGVVFAFILLTSFTEFHDGEIPLTFILIALIYIGREVYNGITVTDNVSQLGHIIGGSVGALIGYFLNKKPAGQK